MLIQLKMLIELLILSVVTCLNFGARNRYREETVLRAEKPNEHFLVEINSYHCSDEVLDELIRNKIKLASTDLAWARLVHHKIYNNLDM